MSRIVIGTAGHIDHGKTALVKALTGIDTDRLIEEKERGITIELGFAPLVLPGGSQAAIIDVPGHERFIKNMLAGAAGIDVALLIVAANEGVMPQTREHLDILRLLAIREVVVVITKIDLVEEDFLTLINEEVQDLIKDTPYRKARIVMVSAYTGVGLDSLLRLIEEIIIALPGRKIREGLVRLPVDRVFKIQGFGTVVTGTLFDGIIRVGDLLEVPTKAAKFKVRNIQVHGKSIQEAMAGQRVAINLAGAEGGNIERGDVLASLGWLSSSNRLDLSVQLLQDSPWELADMVRIRFHQGTKETLGRVFILGSSRMLPGEEGFIQVVLEEPVTVMRGDKFVLRSYSPPRTIGGGRVVEPLASKHKKSQSNLREELVVKASGEPYQLIAYLLERTNGMVSLEQLTRNLGISPDETQKCLTRLINEGKIIEIKAGDETRLYLGIGKLHAWEELIAREINLHLQQFPLSPGLNKEIARSKIGGSINVRDFNGLLQLMYDHKVLRLEDNQYLLPYGFVQEVSAPHAQSLATITALYREAAWQVPEWKLVKERLALNERDSKQLLTFLVREGTLVHINDNLYLPASMLRASLKVLESWFSNNPSLTVGQFRDLLGTTRRVAVPLLEYLDRAKVTCKNGDLRTQGPAFFDSKGVGQV